jgi:ABC-type phosphate transport system substrate-binding protein
MKTKVLAVLIFAILFTIPASAGVKIVVNDKNPVADSMTKDEVADLFLKKSTRWSNGQTVVPLDLTDSNKVRSEFSSTILSRDVTAVKSYWQKMIFSGRATAPVELATEAEVLTFVRKFPAAIGYVSDGAAIPEGVKVINVN